MIPETRLKSAAPTTKGGATVKKIFVISTVAVLAMALTTGICAAESKLGYLDIQKAVGQSAAGKVAKEQLAATFKKYQDEINVKQEELKKLKDELEAQGSMLAASKRAEKEKVYSTKLKNFQEFAKDAQDEMQAKDKELTQKVLESFEKVVQEYGRKNGYIFIFVRTEGIVFADEKADLTDELLKLFNASQQKK
jgi:outer membrane protein